MKYYSAPSVILLCLFVFVGLKSAKAQAFLQSPLSGSYHKEYIIVNYVDWNIDSTIKDHQCGTKTYNGHQGTDFVIRNFRLMDTGVQVLAAADGIVTYIKDGLFDREKHSDTSKKLGNYIALKHSNGYYTYYGHLKKGSIKVKVGDSLKAGAAMAQVGSSGNSSDPHLHFELWWDSLYVVDPFKGSCGNHSTLWLSSPVYDSNFHIWSSAYCNYVTSLDTLKEEPKPQLVFTPTDSIINYWSLLYGIRKGDSLRLDWYNPSGMLWYSFPYKAPTDFWYFYFWTYILFPSSGPEGMWYTQLYRNGVLVQKTYFNVQLKSGIKAQQDGLQQIAIVPNPFQQCFTLYKQLDPKTAVQIFDLSGRKVYESPPQQYYCPDIEAGSYTLKQGQKYYKLYKQE